MAVPARATARASASRRAALKTKCHALLLRGRLAMVDRSWKKPQGRSRERHSTPVGPTACAGPPRSGTLFTSLFLAPGSKHLDETQVESMEHRPDIHDSQRALSELGLRNSSVLPTHSSGISRPACPSSSVQYDKWHLHPPSSSCQTHSSHPNTSSHHGPPRPIPPPTVS